MTNKDIKIKIMVDRVDDSFFVNMTWKYKNHGYFLKYM